MGENTLHQGPGGAEHTENAGRTRGVASDKTLEELWQYRDHKPERQHVEQHGHENERNRAAAHGCGPNGGPRDTIVHDNRLRLCAKGLAFSRNVIRTGVPGNPKASRNELTR